MRRMAADRQKRLSGRVKKGGEAPGPSTQSDGSSFVVGHTLVIDGGTFA